MEWLSSIMARIASTFRREQLSAEVRDELECHLSFLTEQNIQDGMPIAQARCAALRTLGNPDHVRHEYLRAAGFPVIDRLLADARQALLEWRRDRASSAIIMFLLTIGIAVGAFAFALAPQLRQLSSCGSHARGILAIVHYSAHGLGDWNRMEIPIWDSPAEYELWKSKATSFDELTFAEPVNVILDVDGKSTRVRGKRVGDNFFHFLRARAAIGEPSALYKSWSDEQGIVLSNKIWKTAFAADPHVTGRKVHVDGDELHVSGVMPPELSYAGQLWLPLHPQKDAAWMGAHHVTVFARLNPRVSRARAEAELRKLVPTETDPIAQLPEDATTELIPLPRFIDDINEQSIHALLWIGLGILIAAWVNAATLVLQRTVRRTREFSVRRALGAPRDRVAAEISLQIFFLSLIACILAIATVAAADRFLSSSFPSQFAHLPWISVLASECNYVILLAALSIPVCAIPSAFWASRCRPIPVSGFQSDRPGAAGAYHDRWRSALVGCQIAFALTVLVGAGQMFRTFTWQWMKFRFHQAPKNLLAMELGIKQPETMSKKQIAALYDRVLTAAASIPGVESAARTSQPPFYGQMVAAGYPMLINGNHSARALIEYVSPTFFQQFSIPLIRGRMFAENAASGPAEALMSQRTAKAYFAKQDPIGQTICQEPDGGCMAIIGVVGDFQSSYYSSGEEQTVYRAFEDAPDWARKRQTLLLRTKGDAEQYAPLVASTLSKVGPALHIGAPTSLSRNYESVMSQYGSLTFLFVMLSAAAIVLAVIGVYALILQWTASRIREIAIRIALGAGAANIAAITAKKICPVLTFAFLAGLPIALAGAAFLGRILGIPVDRSVMIAGAAMLASIVMLSSYLPARRASRVNPATILRWE